MATFSVDFLGCKVSHTDAQAVRERLLADGHEERAAAREVAVVNTCCVTHEALRKSRHAASRAARTHRRVYVTGCGANLSADAFAGLPENVVVVARRSEETPASSPATSARSPASRPTRGSTACARSSRSRTAASFSCNFCVIPLVRGALAQPARATAVLAEIRRRVAQGHREVVLTGINLGCYRDRDAGYTLARLVREAAATPGLARLRLSSIEVNHVDARARRERCARPRRLARHLHVPLQSGDDGVLRAMAPALHGRHVPAPARARSADFNLTTDVIVGFPGEDEAAFERTLARRRARRALTKVHVFPYSPRPGTDGRRATRCRRP